MSYIGGYDNFDGGMGCEEIDIAEVGVSSMVTSSAMGRTGRKARGAETGIGRQWKTDRVEQMTNSKSHRSIDFLLSPQSG